MLCTTAIAFREERNPPPAEEIHHATRGPDACAPAPRNVEALLTPQELSARTRAHGASPQDPRTIVAGTAGAARACEAGARRGPTP